MAAYPSCVRAIPFPYDARPTNSHDRPEISVCLYMHSNGEGVTDDHRKAAEEMFAGYNVEFFYLKRKPLGEYVTCRSCSDETTPALGNLAKIVEENLHIFENRLNVTAVQPSYKIVKGQETNELCVTVFVLGKGRIPVGEKDFSEVERLSNYPFDIVEGYYVPSSNPFLSSALPSHFGVGIGVEGCEGAGTLGAYLTDDDDRWYLLSCQHVIGKGLPDKRNIVQPAEDDYKKEKEKFQLDIGENKTYIKNLQDSLVENPNDSPMSERTRKNKNKNLKKAEDYVKDQEKKMQYLEEDGTPRHIATYSFGLQENFDYCGNKFFVDAAIAEITTTEREDIASDVRRGTVYGFEEPNRAIPRKPISGEIVNVHEWEDKAEKAHFWKAGRTTRHTEGKKYHSPQLYVNLNGFNKQQCFGELQQIPLILCNSCASNSDRKFLVEPSLLESKICAKCGDEISADGVKKDLWGRNVFLIHGKGDRFSAVGDSGSLIFDAEGQAWGMIFALFGNDHRQFSVATPLDIVIQALNEASGKKLSLLCINPRQVQQE